MHRATRQLATGDRLIDEQTRHINRATILELGTIEQLVERNNIRTQHAGRAYRQPRITAALRE